MADIFFSYSRRDRERVGIVRNALAEMGFEVFWDQETPSGSDWDTWIRGELAKSKCAVVFWSATSIVSDNVRHEAVVAKEQRKLISVFLDQLPARDLPMGFYSQQAADLSKWDGDLEDPEWRKFRGEFEAKLMPRWVHQKLNRVDAELEGERARRETAEAHEKTLRAQISKEAKIQQNLKGERDRALTEVGELTAAAEERDRALQAQTAKQADTEQGLKTERDRAFAEVAKLTSTVEGLSRARLDAGPGEQTKRWLGPIAVGIVLLGAVAVAFVSSPGRKSDSEAEAKFAGLTATVTKSDKARQDAEAKADQATAALTKSDKARQDAEAKATQTAAALAKSEQARQAGEAKAVDAEKARQAAETKATDAEKARQAAVAKADDADKARQTALAKANDADKARLAAEAKLALAIGPSPSGQFSRRSNAEANGSRASPYEVAVVSTVDCERTCSQSNTCKVYTYNKKSGWCYMYSVADLVPNESYDSGVLWTEGNPVPPIPPRPKPNQLTTGQFSPRSNTEVRSGAFSLGNANSAGDCEQACARSNTCKAYSYNKGVAVCYLYSTYAELMPNELFDSGIRN